MGAIDYVNVGAKLVVPEPFQYYWQNLPGVQFETSRFVLAPIFHWIEANQSLNSEEQPWSYKDSKIQAYGIWHQGKVKHTIVCIPN